MKKVRKSAIVISSGSESDSDHLDFDRTLLTCNRPWLRPWLQGGGPLPRRFYEGPDCPNFRQTRLSQLQTDPGAGGFTSTHEAGGYDQEAFWSFSRHWELGLRLQVKVNIEMAKKRIGLEVRIL